MDHRAFRFDHSFDSRNETQSVGHMTDQPGSGPKI